VKPVICLVGAFDRSNFGDLLFPHVVRWGLEQHGVDADFRHYSLRTADLRNRGGVETQPLSSLRRAELPEGSAVVLVGGEILSARWLDAYHGLSSSRRALAAKIVARLIGVGPADALARRAIGDGRPLPWVLGSDDVGRNLPVIYNAVGGIGLDHMPPVLRAELRHRLDRARFLSVRDRETKESLDGWGLQVPVELAPDSGVLIGRLHPRTELLAARTAELDSAIDGLGERYLVFQVGRFPAWGIEAELAAQLAEIHRATGLGILLLPLGQAPGHDDVLPLRKLLRRLRGVPVGLMQRPAVSEILAAIAGSELFVGSSLHGNLSALAYEVPHVAFGRRVMKLDRVLQTWDPTCQDGAVEAERIAARAQEVLRLPDRQLTSARSDVEDSAWRCLQGMAEILR
jgi:hypothetical protein